MTDGNGDPCDGAVAPESADDRRGANLEAAREQMAMLTEALRATKEALASAELLESALKEDLQHGMRNMLAVVRSVFSRTVAGHQTGTDIANHFKGRLDALSRFQNWVTKSSGQTLDLEALILDELLTAAASDDPRITVRGPAVDLTGKAAEAMGLAIHELVTNSIKFGVLFQPEHKGALVIEWTVLPGELNFLWQERGVTVLAAAPLRTGFGRDFIECSMPYEVDAETSFVIEPGAITCRIRLPLAHELAVPQTSGDVAVI